jgi:PAS domain S-box-containing protein
MKYFPRQVSLSAFMRYSYVIGWMLAPAIVIVVGTAVYLYTAANHLENDAHTIVQEQETLLLVGRLLSTVKDAETGQRGFLLTGDETYLEPYIESQTRIDSLLFAFQRRFSDRKEIGTTLQTLISRKMTELDLTIRLRRERGFSFAQSVVATNQGKHLMDSIRQVCDNVQLLEHRKATVATAITNNALYLRSTKLTIIIAAIIVLLLLFGFVFIIQGLLRKSEQGTSALLEQKRFTDAILEMVPSFVYVFDIENRRFDYVSPFFEQLSGYTIAELQDTQANLLWSRIHPDDIEALQHRFAEISTQGQDYNVYESEYRFVHKDGSLRSFVDRGMIFRRNNKGVTTHILAFILDISARARAEEERTHSELLLKSVLNTSLYGIVTLEAIRNEGQEIIDFRYILVNEVAQKSFALSIEEIHESSILNLYPIVMASGQFARYCEVVASGQGAIFDVQFQGDGFDSWFTNVCSRLGDGLIVIYYDISDRKAAEAKIVELNAAIAQKNVELEGLVEKRTAELQRAINELSTTNKQLEESNKELEAFTYSISHDLWAPLRSVNGFAEMLREQYQAAFDEEGQRLLSRIIHGAQKMGVLIDDLLALSRLGRKTLQFAKVDMRTLVQSVVADLNAHLEWTDVRIIIDDIPSVVCDAGVMRQVWVNLISNALKYSRHSMSKVITISASVQPESIEYSIQDNGVGFDMRYADKLFHVFQRLHKEREFEGTGIGLAIVHMVISKHGGRVWAKAEVNKGATFYFSLPNNILPHSPTTLIE